MITTNTLIQYTQMNPAALKLPMWLYAKRPVLQTCYRGEFPPEWEQLYILFMQYSGTEWIVQIPEPSSLVWSEQSTTHYTLEYSYTMGKTARLYFIDLPSGTIPGIVYYGGELYVVEFTMNLVG